MSIEELKKMFAQFKEQLLDEKDWRNLGNIVNLERKKGIDAQVSPDGTPFQPLKPATIRAKQRKGSANPTLALVDTGKYRNAKVEADAKSAKVVVAKSRERIAPYLHEGTSKMPARPNMDVYPEAERKIYEYLKRAIMKRFKTILKQ